MICPNCKAQKHNKCKNHQDYSHCDCQHRVGEKKNGTVRSARSATRRADGGVSNSSGNSARPAN